MARRRYAVLSYDERFVAHLEEFYTVLTGLGGRYRFYCRRGRCWSIIEGGDGVDAVVSSAPGLVVEECSGGCPESSVLLPPPPGELTARPRQVAQGDILVGYAGGVDVSIPREALWSHIGVFGATGAGKTHTAARIARCAAETGEISVLVLDWHNEYYRLLSGARILAGGSLPPVPLLPGSLGVDGAVAALEAVFSLTPNQSLLLSLLLGAAAARDREAAAAMLSPILGDQDTGFAARLASMLVSARDARGLLRAALYAYNARQAVMTKGEAEVWAALIRRLSMIGLDARYAGLFRLSDSGVEHVAREGEAVIVDLSSILNPGVRRLYALLLLESLYTAAQGAEIPPTLIVVEEAHNLVMGNTLQHVLGEARKYRLGLVVVTHTPRLLPPQAVANMNTLFLHRLVSPEDIHAASQVLPRVRELDVAHLASGVALLHTPGLETPILVQVAPPDAAC